MPAHWLLAFKVSGKEHADNLIVNPFYMMSHFLLAAFKILFCLLLSTVYVFQCGSLWIHLIWISLRFLHIYIHVFLQICEVFRHYFFKKSQPISFFLVSSNGMLILLKVSCKFLKFCSPLLNIYCSSHLISIVLSSSSLILLPAQIYFWILLKFSLVIILLRSSFLFLYFPFIDISILFTHHFFDFLHISF